MVSIEHPNLISIMDIEKLSHDESGALQGGFRVVRYNRQARLNLQGHLGPNTF